MKKKYFPLTIIDLPKNDQKKVKLQQTSVEDKSSQIITVSKKENIELKVYASISMKKKEKSLKKYLTRQLKFVKNTPEHFIVVWKEDEDEFKKYRNFSLKLINLSEESNTCDKYLKKAKHSDNLCIGGIDIMNKNEHIFTLEECEWKKYGYVGLKCVGNEKFLSKDLKFDQKTPFPLLFNIFPFCKGEKKINPFIRIKSKMWKTFVIANKQKNGCIEMKCSSKKKDIDNTKFYVCYEDIYKEKEDVKFTLRTIYGSKIRVDEEGVIETMKDKKLDDCGDICFCQMYMIGVKEAVMEGNGKFLNASPEGDIIFSSEYIGSWEIFKIYLECLY